MQCKRV